MSAPVFVALDHDDPVQVRSLQELAASAPRPLLSHDRSPPEPLRDRRGRRVHLTPSDRRSEPLRTALIDQFHQCERLLVLIGTRADEHAWIEWEIRTFFEVKQAVAGPRAWKHVRGMRLRGVRGHDPAALAGRATVTIDWSPATLTRWLETPL